MSTQTQTKQTDLTHNFLENFKTFGESINGSEPSWVNDIRKAAIKSFEDSGVPTNRNEEYKYTNFNKLLKGQSFQLPEPSDHADLKDEDIAPYLFNNIEANELVFINGVLSKEHSRIISKESNIVIKDFSEALVEQPELVKKYFSREADYTKDAFTALNTAFSNNGAFIHIPKGKIIEEPVILHFFNNTRNGNILVNPRNLIIAEEDAQAKFIETYHTLGEHAGLTNTVTEIVMGRLANIEYHKIQNETENAHHIGTTQVHQEEESQLDANTITLRGGSVRNNLNIVLNGEHIHSKLYGLYLLKGKQHVDNHTAVDHRKPNSTSDELYKGILDDYSTGVFNGKVFVRQEAQKTNAYQSNNNILLTDNATINTKPQLEIWADDVSCSHGATSGHLDERALFYMRARGMSKAKAKSLLMYAFAGDILNNIRIEPLREYLDQLLTERLSEEA